MASLGSAAAFSGRMVWLRWVFGGRVTADEEEAMPELEAAQFAKQSYYNIKSNIKHSLGKFREVNTEKSFGVLQAAGDDMPLLPHHLC